MDNNIYSINQKKEIDYNINCSNPQYLNSKINNLVLNDEFKYLNSLSSSIKEYYLKVNNIIKDLKNNVLELNKHILTSKCLINEMINNMNVQERINKFNKHLECMNLINKFINNNISLFEVNFNKLFEDSKSVFKKAKDFKSKNIYDINSIPNLCSTGSNKKSNQNQAMLEKNNFSQYNNKKISCLKLSLDTNKINSFSNININKSNSNNRIKRTIWNNKDPFGIKMISASNKNEYKHKSGNLSLEDINILEEKIKNRTSKHRIISQDKNTILRSTKLTKNKIVTELPLTNVDKIKYLFYSSPIKRRKSISNEKVKVPQLKYSNNFSSIRNKYSSSGNTTSRKNEDNCCNYNLGYMHNNYSSKKSKEKEIDFNSSIYENSKINSIKDLIQNIIDYFYLLNQYQSYIIVLNKSFNNNNSNNLSLRLKKSLLKINKLLFINNDFLINTNIKQKFFSLINQNKNVNQKIQMIVSRLNYNNLSNKKIDINNDNDKVIFDYINKNGNNTIEANDKSIRYKILSSYNKTIEKLKNDNKNLSILNQRIINQNKLLNEKLNLKESNKNTDNALNKIIKENKEYIFQIKNLKKDNEELLKLIKNKNNNNNSGMKKESTPNNSNDSINASNTKDSNNLIIIQKDNEIKRLQSLLEENEIKNTKLKENEQEKDNKIKELNQEILSFKNKYDTNIILINEKNSIIKELNSNINELKNEINNNKNNYSNDIVKLKSQIENIKNKENEIDELKKVINDNNNIIDNLNKDKSHLEKELTNKNETIKELNEKYNEILNSKKIKKSDDKDDIDKTDKNKNFMVEKEKEIIALKNKIKELENKNEKIEKEKNSLILKSDEQKNEISQLESIINVLKEKFNSDNNNDIKKSKEKKDDKINDNKNNDNSKEIEENYEDDKIDIHDLENEVINYKKEDNEIDSKKNNIEENNQYSIEMLEDNGNENESKRLSTPSFNSPELDLEEDINNYKIRNKKEIESIDELKMLNEILLKKVTKYESFLKINPIKESDQIEENNNIKDSNSEIKYFQDQYIKYFKLYQDQKKKYEFYENSNDIIKNDLINAKNKIKELTKKLKDNNIETENNYITTLSSLKLNNQYGPNEYIILCDKTYEDFKWFLMKKRRSQVEDEEIDSYDNFIWVPRIDVVDLEKFNKYANENEQSNNDEVLNFVKKLEEKENMISILSYKLEKLEREIERNNTYNNYDINIKDKNNKYNIFKSSISEENIFTNDKSSIYRKYSSKDKKSSIDEQLIPIEKYNKLLEKLNETEARFMKLQQENSELKQYKVMHISQNNGNEIKKDEISDYGKLTFMANNFSKSENGLGLVNNNFNIDRNSFNQNEEIKYYKNKYNEIEMKLKIIKESFQNILMRVTIPKKDKKEIKQILKLCDFSEDEILIIVGDKKK